MSSGLSGKDGLDFEVKPEELALYRSYLDVLGRVTNLLLEDTGEESWEEVLRLLAGAARINHCALYLNQPGEEGSQRAQLRALCVCPPT